MSPWWLIDKQADIIDNLSVKWIRRISVLMFNLSVVFFGYAPFTKEPPIIYMMSVLALLFSAILAIITTKIEQEQE